jgi:hypothetical protein
VMIPISCPAQVVDEEAAPGPGPHRRAAWRGVRSTGVFCDGLLQVSTRFSAVRLHRLVHPPTHCFHSSPATVLLVPQGHPVFLYQPAAEPDTCIGSVH